jgi:hypothetical protein
LASEIKEETAYWKLFIIEFCIPFGRGTEYEYETALKYVNRFNIVKSKGVMDK